MNFKILLLLSPLIPIVGFSQNTTTTLNKCQECELPTDTRNNVQNIQQDTVYKSDTVKTHTIINTTDTINTVVNIKDTIRNITYLETVIDSSTSNTCQDSILNPDLWFRAGYYNRISLEILYKWKDFNTGLLLQYQNGCGEVCGIEGKFKIIPFVERYWKINNLFKVGARLEWGDRFTFVTPIGYSGKNIDIMLAPRYKGNREIEFGLIIYLNKKYGKIRKVNRSSVDRSN